MKNTLFILLLAITSCTLTPKKGMMIIVNESEADTISISANPKNVLVLSKEQSDLINSFRQPMKDAAYYMLTHEDKQKIGRFRYCCGTYEFWIANGYAFFKMESPIGYSMNDSEKRFFWGLYVDYRDNEMRLYEWESKIDVVVK